MKKFILIGSTLGGGFILGSLFTAGAIIKAFWNINGKENSNIIVRHTKEAIADMMYMAFTGRVWTEPVKKNHVPYPMYSKPLSSETCDEDDIKPCKYSGTKEIYEEPCCKACGAEVEDDCMLSEDGDEDSCEEIYKDSSINYHEDSCEETSKNAGQVGSGRKVRELVFDTREEAESMVDKMVEVIKTYGYATLVDYYNLAGKPEMSDYNDYKYGWNDKNHFRDNALVHMCNNGGTTKYTLVVPDATIINHVYYV